MTDPSQFDPRLEQMLSEWDEAPAESKPDPSDLCARYGCPELEPTLRSLIAMLTGLNLLGRTATHDTPGAVPTRTPAEREPKPPAWPGIPGFAPAGSPLVGGMGIVFPVKEEATGHYLALKVLSSPPGGGSLVSLRRFRREVVLLAQLDHPNVVRFRGAGEWQGQVFLTMELVTGRSLKERRAEFAETRLAVELLAKVARAVHYLHECGVIHRDLKPGNILLTDAGEPKVADFGLAKHLDTSATSLTQTGQVQGSPAYMAPEQWQGDHDRIGRATDVWALGVTLYELLAGQTPFAATRVREIQAQVLAAEPKPILGIDDRLQAVVRVCLQKEPEQRYASAAALADDLEAWLAGRLTRSLPRAKPSRRRTLQTLGGGVAVCSLTALSVFAWNRRNGGPKDFERQLLAGQPVPLLDDLTRPRWVGVAPGVIEQIEGGARVLADDWKLLELAVLPAGLEFELTADIVQEQNPDNGRVGLYFGRREHDPDGQKHQTLFESTFNDFPPKPPRAGAVNGSLTHDLCYDFELPPTTERGIPRMQFWGGFEFLARKGTRRYTLTLTVRRDAVGCRFAGADRTEEWVQPIGNLQFAWSAQGKPVPELPNIRALPFATFGGVGLSIIGCTAAVTGAAVTRLVPA